MNCPHCPRENFATRPALENHVRIMHPYAPRERPDATGYDGAAVLGTGSITALSCGSECDDKK